MPEKTGRDLVRMDEEAAMVSDLTPVADGLPLGGLGLRPSLWRRTVKRAGIDRAIGYTILARGWSSSAGLITVALIAHTLTRAQQGFYYTFGSLVALQIVFELGFSVVVLQMATHETAQLQILDDGRVLGDLRARQRLASVLQKAVKWYTLAAVLMGCVLLPVGWRFFVGSPGAGDTAWRGPWIAVVLASCFTFQIDPIFSFLEGCGMVSRVARTRFTQSILGSSLAWAALLLHRGLFAPSMLITGQAIAGAYFLWTRRKLLVGLLRMTVGEHAIHWGTEVWPFQWRVAISYASGFLIFQLFNPVLLRFYGPVVAGQMGMSLNISNALAAVAVAWINTKAAMFGTMIARREYGALDRLFFRSVAQTMLLCVSGSVVAWSLVVLMGYEHVKFAQRLLSPLPFALLLATMCLNLTVSSMALYLRAHKQEKFLLNSVLGGIVVATSTLTLGRWYGPTGMTAGHLTATLLIGIGMGSYTFVKYRRLWHA
ncbi:lipopolysaccharide biosynthesis protein [Terriglobus saanensis]|nr:hypothetical protein [Terriglobus saanensis]